MSGRLGKEGERWRGELWRSLCPQMEGTGIRSSSEHLTAIVLLTYYNKEALNSGIDQFWMKSFPRALSRFVVSGFLLVRELMLLGLETRLSLDLHWCMCICSISYTPKTLILTFSRCPQLVPPSAEPELVGWTALYCPPWQQVSRLTTVLLHQACPVAASGLADLHSVPLQHALVWTKWQGYRGVKHCLEWLKIQTWNIFQSFTLKILTR